MTGGRIGLSSQTTLPALTTQDRERYSRHLMIPEIGEIGQQRLKASRVLVIGAGGLGSPCLMYLAAAGVGTIGIVDFDIVSSSNLQRQIIHQQADVGRPKTESACDAIAALNPNTTVFLHQIRLDPNNAPPLFSAYDLVLDCTDNFETRYLINEVHIALQRPYIWGTVYRFEGQATVFDPVQGPCYRCLYETSPPETIPTASQAGVFGVVCSTIASIQTAEAIKLLMGVGETLIGRLITFDGLDMKFNEIAISRVPSCSACQPIHRS